MPESEIQPKIDPNSPWRDREGIAAYYAKSVRTIDAWKRKRILPCIQQGRNVLFNIHDCDRALKAGYQSNSIALAE